jgi:hypothetical protein
VVDVVSFVPANESGKNDPLVPAVGEATLVLNHTVVRRDHVVARASTSSRARADTRPLPKPSRRRRLGRHPARGSAAAASAQQRLNN